MNSEALKREAAEAAAAEVEDGMRLGLGTGSTVSHLLEVLAGRVRAGLRIRGVPTSSRTEAHARSLGIPLSTLDEMPELDLCIDGADEVDFRLDCLKGLGGACLREKVVAAASRRFVLIVDESKLMASLGTRVPVVVETIPFAASVVARSLRDLDPRLRMADRGGAPSEGGSSADRGMAPGTHAASPYLTDNGNLLLELWTGPIDAPDTLAARLDRIPGIAGHGLFLGMAQAAYVASPGGVRKLDREDSSRP